MRRAITAPRSRLAAAPRAAPPAESGRGGEESALKPAGAGDLLVVARSGRLLAAAARAAGYTVHVIDQFGDLDTRAMAASVTCVRAGPALSFVPAALLRAVEAVMQRHPIFGIVLGAGFEGAPHLVAQLAARHRVLGCASHSLATLADRPRALARLARHTHICVPPTRRAPPPRAQGWLSKRDGDCGGGHILPAAHAPREPARYYQRELAGASLSALYVAARGACTLIGMAEHLRWHPQAPAPWRYEGALAIAPGQAARTLTTIGRAVAREFDLTGCFGLDFIHAADGRYVVVDINPRAPATLELCAQMGRVFAAHVAACTDGTLLYSRPPSRLRRGHLLLYAERCWRVPRNLTWPAWIADRPPAGQVIEAGAPLCSLRAAAYSRSALCAALAQRWRALQRLLGGAARAPLPTTLCLRNLGDV